MKFSNKYKRRGWFFDSFKHGLAAKGIKTKVKRYGVKAKTKFGDYISNISWDKKSVVRKYQEKKRKQMNEEWAEDDEDREYNRPLTKEEKRELDEEYKKHLMEEEELEKDEEEEYNRPLTKEEKKRKTKKRMMTKEQKDIGKNVGYRYGLFDMSVVDRPHSGAWVVDPKDSMRSIRQTSTIKDYERSLEKAKKEKYFEGVR